MTLARDTSNEEVGSISWLLANVTEIVDLPRETHVFIDRQFSNVGTYMASLPVSDWSVYPQGSLRLGTVVRPIAGPGTLDVDMVCLRDIAKESTTQKGLMSEAGKALRAYIAQAPDEDAPDTCEARRRCWQLGYPFDFHMDVLPVVPDRQAKSETAILVTDKELKIWLPSDPIAYAEWFRGLMAIEWQELMEARAFKLSKSIEQIPEWEVKTMLQRVVQILKAHRDLHFIDDPDDRPPSILITTLAAYAFRGGRDLFEATLFVASHMADYIEGTASRPVVKSPVSEENFADKWGQYPMRRRKFEDWLDTVRRDLEEAANSSGIRGIVDRLSPSFGEGVMIKAAGMMGVETRELRDTRKLGVVGGGVTLSTAAAAAAIPKQRFYGRSK